jgi:hypothetical protein
MRTLFIFCLIFGLSSTFARAESIVPDPNDWFKNQYAPTWKDVPWNHVDEIAKFYAETISVHSPGNTEPMVPSLPWLSQIINSWKSDGWVSSILLGSQSDRLNHSAVLFKAKWLDMHSDGSEEFSCGWYMADLFHGRWLVVAYAEIECKDHQL